MSFFNFEVPIFMPKRSAFDVPAMPGVWRFHLQIQGQVLYSSFYTRHDQACLLWGVISALIFLAAQFLPVSWSIQTIVAFTFTGMGMVGMMLLTWKFVLFERLGWVLGIWALLMSLGAIATCQGIFGGWTWALINICPLWLSLSGLGYFATSLGMRSRLFLLLSLIHLVGIMLLPYFPAWKPLMTGLIISGSAFFVAEFQWDANGVCGYQMQAIESEF